MEDKKSAKQINPDVKLKGKYQDALKSPLHELESKETVISEAQTNDSSDQ